MQNLMQKFRQGSFAFEKPERRMHISFFPISINVCLRFLLFCLDRAERDQLHLQTHLQKPVFLLLFITDDLNKILQNLQTSFCRNR